MTRSHTSKLYVTMEMHVGGGGGGGRGEQPWIWYLEMWHTSLGMEAIPLPIGVGLSAAPVDMDVATSRGDLRHICRHPPSLSVLALQDLALLPLPSSDSESSDEGVDEPTSDPEGQEQARLVTLKLPKARCAKKRNIEELEPKKN